MSDVGARLEAAGLRVTRNAPSAALTTYRCGGPLAVLVRAGDEGELRTLAGVLGDERVLIVGRGSNLLVADHGFPGVALLLDGEFERCEIDSGTGRVEVGAAVPLPVLARRVAAAGVGGLEFYVGIPGTVGGAVRMNAGGHGRDTAEVLRSARCVDLGTGRSADRPVAELGLGFRTSALGAREVVCSAVLAGAPAPAAEVEARLAEIVRWRREHQPGGANAGSVFVNPPGDAAGRLIEASGAKGLRVGGAAVSEKHANFIVAEPGATAADVVAVLEAVRGRVEAAFGVRLRPEVHLVGFEEEAGR